MSCIIDAVNKVHYIKEMSGGNEVISSVAVFSNRRILVNLKASENVKALYVYDVLSPE